MKIYRSFPEKMNGDRLDNLTLIHPFFGEKKRFALQFDHWMSLSEELKNRLNIVVVDDHGTPSVESLMTDERKAKCDFNLTILRIDDDIKYNTAGALNLGIIISATPWVLIMDSDCAFLDNMQEILDLKPHRNRFYKFNRQRITEDKAKEAVTRYLPCTILMYKDMFLDINGFDEDFCNATVDGYGHFDIFFSQRAIKAGYKQGQIKTIPATEWMEDIVGDKVQRGEKAGIRNRKLGYRKNGGEVPISTDMLRFKWHVAFRNKRSSQRICRLLGDRI
jgi:hypothetical protein